MANVAPKAFYYITHINNVPSILERGILSHVLVAKEHIPTAGIYDEQIVTQRQKRKMPDDRSLWDYANVYFHARNVMLYRVLRELSEEEIVVLSISAKILNLPGVFVTTGNAASGDSDILPPNEGLPIVATYKPLMDEAYWSSNDGSKRKIMAECLVPDRIPAKFIEGIYVASQSVREKFPFPKKDITVTPEPNLFFAPHTTIPLTKHLALVNGDIFFSQAQTLTISVNTVGIMGKGLASRAKYQFPDVFVVYQDQCKSKKNPLTMGTPYLYKWETFLDDELGERGQPQLEGKQRQMVFIVSNKTPLAGTF
ncbi:MAG TPA: DarT ssDNA thymidine ADP-ribosyltransferase family protein [Aggregatilineales bacterium]|nr:DarT ssDNA thymidine ADP-ribosyltransferase family protein [Aggregatilineales bacterium]